MDPHNPGRVSVTIKADGKDGTWIVVHGSPAEIRSQLVEIFELSAEEADAPLYDLIHEVTRAYKATSAANRSLGGRVLRPGAEEAVAAPAASPAWEQAAAVANVSPADKLKASLLERVENSPSVSELKKLWANNQQVFSDHQELMDAYMKKGPELKSAGKL